MYLQDRPSDLLIEKLQIVLREHSNHLLMMIIILLLHLKFQLDYAQIEKVSSNLDYIQLNSDLFISAHSELTAVRKLSWFLDRYKFINYKYLPTFDNKPVYKIFWSTKILLLPYISSRRYYILLHRVVDSLQNLVSRITFVPATTTAYFKFFIFLGRYSTCLKILVFLLLNNKVGFGICVRTYNPHLLLALLSTPTSLYEMKWNSNLKPGALTYFLTSIWSSCEP